MAIKRGGTPSNPSDLVMAIYYYFGEDTFTTAEVNMFYPLHRNVLGNLARTGWLIVHRHSKPHVYRFKKNAYRRIKANVHGYYYKKSLTDGGKRFCYCKQKG